MSVKRQIFINNKDIDGKIANNATMGARNDMENFKLMTVAKTMGIEIDENKLHDATYDIELTRDIFYKIINKMDVKL